MKLFKLLLILSCLPFLLHAQNSLTFNQVKLITAADSVPAGKVWKVESVLSNRKSIQDSAFTILVNNENVYVSKYESGDRYWDNIQQILWETRKAGGLSCSNTTTQTFRFELSGYENNLPFENESYTWTYTPNSYPTAWTPMFTVAPQVPANELAVFSMRFGGPFSVRIPDQVQFRMTVTYKDGSTQSRIFGPYTFTCCGCGGGSAFYVLGNSGGHFSFPPTQKDFFYLPTRLPMWLPAGTRLAPGGNTGSISVIEFNTTP